MRQRSDATRICDRRNAYRTNKGRSKIFNLFLGVHLYIGFLIKDNGLTAIVISKSKNEQNKSAKGCRGFQSTRSYSLSAYLEEAAKCFDDDFVPESSDKIAHEHFFNKDSVLNLSKVITIVIDEVHELSVPTELVLAIAKFVCAHRPDRLKLVVMSATLSTQKYMDYLPGSIALNILGAAFPVEISYSSENIVRNMDYSGAVLSKVKETMYTELLGDILAFLPAVEDVKTCYHTLHKTSPLGHPARNPAHQAGHNNHCWTFSKHVVNLLLCFCIQSLLKASQPTASIIIYGLIYVDDCGWMASHHPGLPFAGQRKISRQLTLSCSKTSLRTRSESP